jgi:hypothetical protein
MRRPLGLAALALGVGFNLPYAWLAAHFGYPAILREPAPDVLSAFAAGGPQLLLAWYAFMLSALALTAISPALAITPARLASAPATAIGAALAGALAGLAQAIGLARWVFVVPQLAQTPDSAAQAFTVLNLWGGVAIGEHLGQLLTALFLAQMARLQATEGCRTSAALAATAAFTITIGTGEGLAIALGGTGEAFSAFTIAGYAALTLWLLSTGSALLRMPSVRGITA